MWFRIVRSLVFEHYVVMFSHYLLQGPLAGFKYHTTIEVRARNLTSQCLLLWSLPAAGILDAGELRFNMFILLSYLYIVLCSLQTWFLYWRVKTIEWYSRLMLEVQFCYSVVLYRRYIDLDACLGVLGPFARHAQAHTDFNFFFCPLLFP